jgi:hypothetical protein
VGLTAFPLTLPCNLTFHPQSFSESRFRLPQHHNYVLKSHKHWCHVTFFPEFRKHLVSNFRRPLGISPAWLSPSLHDAIMCLSSFWQQSPTSTFELLTFRNFPSEPIIFSLRLFRPPPLTTQSIADSQKYRTHRSHDYSYHILSCSLYQMLLIILLTLSLHHVPSFKTLFLVSRVRLSASRALPSFRILKESATSCVRFLVSKPKVHTSFSTSDRHPRFPPHCCLFQQRWKALQSFSSLFHLKIVILIIANYLSFQGSKSNFKLSIPIPDRHPRLPQHRRLLQHLRQHRSDHHFHRSPPRYFHSRLPVLLHLQRSVPSGRNSSCPRHVPVRLRLLRGLLRQPKHPPVGGDFRSGGPGGEQPGGVNGAGAGGSGAGCGE